MRHRITCATSFALALLESGWSHCHRSSVVWINRGFSIIVVHAHGLRWYFGPCSLLFVSCVWSHEYRNHGSCADDSSFYLSHFYLLPLPIKQQCTSIVRRGLASTDSEKIGQEREESNMWTSDWNCIVLTVWPPILSVSRRLHFQTEPSTPLSPQWNVQDLSEQWEHLKIALRSAATVKQDSMLWKLQKW